MRKDKGEYKIPFSVDPEIKSEKGTFVEARCVKFSPKSRYEIAWPDYCFLHLGKHKVQEFKPLTVTSPLKRRNDEPVKLDKLKLIKESELVVE